MPSLPIPMISALILGFLFVALVLKRDRHWLLSVLVGACALQSLVVSLGQHYGVGVIAAVQPVSAMFVPPLAWVAFQVTAVRPPAGCTRRPPSRWPDSGGALCPVSAKRP